MVIYILMILVSTFCIALSEINEKNKKKKNSIFFVVLGLSLPILLAAYRKIGVGTDTKVYISFDFYRALRFNNIFEYFKSSENEILHLSINYIVSRLTSNLQILFGVMQTIVVLLIYGIARNNKKVSPIWFTYMLLMFMYYNKSLNMLRQMISCLIVLYAFNFLEEKNYKKFFLFVIVALGFHKTAVMGIVIFFFYEFTKTKNAVVKFYLLIVCLLFALFNYTNLITLAVNMGLLEKRYLAYINMVKVNVSTTEMIIKTVMMGIVLIFSKALYQKDKRNLFFCFLIVIDFILYCFGNFSSYAERFSYYFGVFQIMNFIQIPNIGKNGYDVTALRFIIGISALLYSNIIYGILKLDETVPYILYFKE